jgi:AraC-like DNA-binding protein
MIYQLYSPSSLLRPYIRDYLVLHLRLDKQSIVPQKVYPVLPEQGFTFYVRGFVVADTPDMNLLDERPRSVIWGQTLHRQNLNVANNNEYLMINVCFQTGALFKLFRIPMTEFLHKNIDAEAVFGREIWEINEKLANAKSYDELISIVDNFFIEKLKKRNDGRLHPIDKIPLMILQNPTQFDLKKIASDACLSNSQFERKFTQQVGITPKFFAKISRFAQAFQLKERQPHLDWLSVAVQTGYYDYQHLAKDFKRFSGNMPNSLLSEWENSPEKWFNLV